MRIATKRLLLRLATAAVVVCAAAVVMLPAGAYAASATASAGVAVRAAPSSTSVRLDTLYAGETVNVVGCRSGWCYVQHIGPDGYVSAQYLRRGTVRLDPNFNFSFTFGNGMFSFGIGNGTTPPSHAAQVCFYRDFNYAGPNFCMNSGTSIRALSSWNDRISSFRNPDGLRVTLCTDFGYAGHCRTYTASSRNVGDFNDEISSIRVR